MRKSLTLLCFALLSSLVLLAQTRIIKGRVADEKGNPLPGASVQVRGTKTGTTTDAEGNFSIAVPTTAKSLLVSSLNYVNKEFAIGNGNTFTITLKANDASLEEVVVMGYSTVKQISPDL
jgi:iron complex outermembrane receptor protein